MRLLKPNPVIRALYLSALLGWAGVSASAESSDLIEKNPFLPDGYGEEKAAPEKPTRVMPGTVERQLEFRGVYEFRGETRIGVYDKKANKSYWVAENESVESIRVGKYNPRDGSVVVTMNGVTETLEIATPNEQPMAIPKVAQPANAPPTITPSATTQRITTSGNSRNIPRRRVVLPKKN